MLATLPAMFDGNARARQRLDEELIAWMTTVRPDGRPQTLPVWFLVEGEEILVDHAGTRSEGGRLLTAGGRVLAVGALGDGLADARETFLFHTDEATADAAVRGEATPAADGTMTEVHACLLSGRGKC